MKVSDFDYALPAERIAQRDECFDPASCLVLTALGALVAGGEGRLSQAVEENLGAREIGAEGKPGQE